MERVGVEESLIGDLAEQRRAGRSALWLWRQTVIAVAQRFEVIAQQDPTRLGIKAGVVALALSLPYVWMHFLWHYAVLLDMAWYPGSMNWLARSSPHVVWQLVVFLHPWDGRTRQDGASCSPASHGAWLASTRASAV
jgi:hypothetical protein